MSKGKTFVFVDTENVGHAMPTKIPKTMKAYFYIKDKNILPKVYPSCMHKRIKLIDLATRATKTKNEMDLALVTQLSIAIAKHGKKRKYVVLSNDKGYDYPIHLLRQSYGVDLNRVCCSLDEYIGQLTGDVKDQPEEKPEPAAAQPEPKRPESVETKPLEEIIYDPGLFARCDDFDAYRRAQKNAQKKQFRKYRQMYRGGSNLWIEYDPYANVWVPFACGVPIETVKPNQDPEKVCAAITKWKTEAEQQEEPAVKKPLPKKRPKKKPRPKKVERKRPLHEIPF